ncbi:hypothetical protein [Embleya sp. NPDC001921]
MAATVTAQRVVAVAGVVIGVATGVVTNLITDRWSWTLSAVLIVLVVVAATFAVVGVNSPGGRTRARRRAERGGRIEHSRVRARGGADVTVTATRDGLIRNSPVTVNDADVDQRAGRRGRIVDSPLDVDP